jgi:hypothetical protein
LLTWDSQRFNQSGEHEKLLAAVASWKRVQHLEATEPIECADPAIAQVFKGLNAQELGSSKARDPPGRPAKGCYPFIFLS